ncbi:hypothetical protein ACLBKS_00220 [Hylemonella sp. W303a]|uniref:hypothetical protein n=1 Tax=Hylemonella sp. W303a TaxID=3389873 RepID=UPI00396B2611
MEETFKRAMVAPVGGCWTIGLMQGSGRVAVGARVDGVSCVGSLGQLPREPHHCGFDDGFPHFSGTSLA